jgi:F-type H+-transporting ATPase subunit gamma
MALKQIKNKIASTKKTGKVTKAMESVSAVKMRKSQERAFASRPYVHAAMRILSRVSSRLMTLSSIHSHKSVLMESVSSSW